MINSYYIGVDGGATKCTVRIEDAAGKLLGRTTTGPASIRLSVDQAWHSINDGLNKILTENTLSLTAANCRFYAGMGLAGCEIKEAYERFIQQSHGFHALAVSSDAHTACLGAHGGKDGAVIIAGTGVVGYQIQAGNSMKVGGWGFPHDDEGGGAWLGLEAVKNTVRWLDQRLPASPLALSVFARFQNNKDELTRWANSADATAFAELAPLVFACAKQQDKTALDIIARAAVAINQVAEALMVMQVNQLTSLPCSLTGSVALLLEPYLDAGLRMRLCLSQAPPDVGGIYLAKQLEKDNA